MYNMYMRIAGLHDECSCNDRTDVLARIHMRETTATQLSEERHGFLLNYTGELKLHGKWLRCYDD